MCVFQGQYMEGRHCLSAASVISGLAGEVPSEEAAQESEYLAKISHFCTFLSFITFRHTSACHSWSDILLSDFPMQVRRRASGEKSSGSREQTLQDAGSNTVWTSCRTLRSCWRYESRPSPGVSLFWLQIFPFFLNNLLWYVCVQDNIGELNPDRQEELKSERRNDQEEEEKRRKSALLFGSEDTFDSIASQEEKVGVACWETFCFFAAKHKLSILSSLISHQFRMMLNVDITLIDSKVLSDGDPGEFHWVQFELLDKRLELACAYIFI